MDQETWTKTGSMNAFLKGHDFTRSGKTQSEAAL
jgi:hypothetical protein